MKYSLIVHNLRSCHNVGSLLRTTEGLGITDVWLTGHTPYPSKENDTRLPHIARKLNAQIHKTALGAEKLIDWRHSEQIEPVLKQLKQEGFIIAGLEQHQKAINLAQFTPPPKIALIIGNEVSGLDAEILSLCSVILEIPMLGKKESFNVVQATAMALFHFTTVK
ncbi:TrmH family RNA methyltransferase [Candidatus Saccharibacteria bacterium]|nr:TrmH family RNA methyltransferase [Candidatus Saccharibacteria bacterium]MBI3338098.1 TrmH family RNA methyltransferase [Candidatus Saccharibacteria bacterium]